MVKARTPATAVKPVERATDIDARIEKFASSADGNTSQSLKPLDKDAPRNFKSINVPLNEYENAVLENLCKQQNRSKLNMIRHAILKMAEDEGN